MENNEKSQITFFMQNLSDKMDEIIKNTKSITSKLELEKGDGDPINLDAYFNPIKERLNTLCLNDESILKKIEVSKPDKIVSPTKNYQTNIINYNLLDTDFYKKHQKKLLAITLVLFFIPSLLYIYKTAVLRNKLENYKTFYTYFNLINLKKDDEKNLKNIKILFNQIKNNDEHFLEEYNKLKETYLIH